RASLTSGTAVMNVPDSATGFVLETPNGYAIDYGTRFSVEINEEGNTADFALIEGKIELHHAESGDSRMLSDSGASAVVSAESIVVETGDVEEQVQATPRMAREDGSFRVSSNGRCRSVLRFEKFQDRKIFDELLYVKSGNNPNWDYKSFFQFDVSEVDRERLSDARLRLNLVPTPLGVASLLPRVNRFAVYGITDPEARQWREGVLWSDAPNPEDGVLLGQFEILRSQERGTFGIDGDRLVTYIQEHGDEPITLLVTRETGKTDGVGKVLVHAFASDTHPQSVGPQLEMVVSQ
ncbi:MAG: iron dicitrate transport regulator FecR, partial [Planctomycetota bacterium]